MCQAVIKEILRRKTGAAASGARLGLVIEGGGMRGVYSAGALLALSEAGLQSTFDAVFAESAGAINACYFLADQVEIGLSIYLEDLRSMRFFNPFRLNRMLDIDFLIDQIVAQSKALDIAKVLASPTRLHVALTNALDGSPLLIDVKKTQHPLLEVLRATAAMVPLYNRPVLLEGIPYVDGGIGNPIPILSAIEAGCTHILALLTRPRSFRVREFSPRQAAMLSRSLGRWPPAFRETLLHHRVQRYKQARAIAYRETGHYPTVNIMAIEPGPLSPQVGRVTRSETKLRAAIEEARLRTHAALGL